MSTRLADLARPFDIIGGAETRILHVTEDSRQVRPGSLFVAVRGTADDGARYLADAAARGAVAVATDRADLTPAGLPVVVVPDARAALAHFARELQGNPAAALEVIGFTGTFGKTTTSYILQQLLNAAGRRTAVVGSLGARFEDVALSLSGMTTPSPTVLYPALRALVDAGATSVVMEVTSHALQQDRICGLTLSGGLIAAIRPGEHTDFHRSYEDYVGAKRRFLRHLKEGAVLAYDADNRASAQLARERPDVRDAGFSLRRAAIGEQSPAGERRGVNLSDRRLLALADAVLDANGAMLTVDGVHLRSALLGRANLRNVALALTFARQAGLRMEHACDALASLTPLRRRMERTELSGRTVLDDTAGHPESFDATFEVADLLPASRIVIAYALRGSRGADINRRNALSLADHALTLRAARLVITEAAETAGPLDQVTASERQAAQTAFRERGVEPVWHETMASAMADVATSTTRGDLIVLVGAQGMNAGRDALMQALREG